MTPGGPGASAPRLVVEADGASRGNPGPSAYGAVVRDATTGDVLAETGEAIGITTNNVAEYRGLVAGLELAGRVAPGAAVEVRMDSQLVVEQMSGRWRVKHPELKPLAAEAGRLAPEGTTYTWVPRADNAHADRLANEALDARGAETDAEVETEAALEEDDRAQPAPRGWATPGVAATRIVLVRHGETDHTTEKRFSGGLASSNPGLNDRGRAQVRATAEWLAPLADQVDAVVTSPVRRTRESAEILAEVLGKHEIEVEDGFAEMEFGAWDGLTFAEVAERHQDDLDAWLGSLEAAPHGGESFQHVQERVLAGLERTLQAHAGRTVVVVSHVTPIKTLVAHALDAPLMSVYRMELSPASVTVISFFGGGPDGSEPSASMRLFNGRPPGEAPFGDPTRW